MKFTIRETDSQGRKIKWMTNTECVRVFAGKDIGECCENCRFLECKTKRAARQQIWNDGGYEYGSEMSDGRRAD